MKEKSDQAGGLPKRMKETALPNPPAEPAPVDPQALKAKALQQTAEGMRSMKGIRGALDLVALIHFLSGNPGSVLYPLGRRALSRAISSDTAMRFLTQPSEAELQMVNPKKVYPNKAAAIAAKKASEQ